MKIGEFAKIFDAPVDTIRYYIDNGMLLPEKMHGQYRFDDRCVEDMNSIRELKKMKFTINEIKKLISLQRLTNLIEEENLKYYASFFEEKKEELLEDKKSIEESIKSIEEKLGDIEKKRNKLSTHIGIPLHFFNYLYCPKCQQNLKLFKAVVDGNYIYNGELKCECGYTAEISDGIIITQSARSDESPVIEPGKNSVEDYLKKTDTLFISFIQKSIDWILKRMNFKDIKNKTILELGTGKGFVLNQMISKMDSSNAFVASDVNYSRLKTTKKTIERSGIKKPYIFIASNLSELPLKRGSVDIVLDIFGTTNHTFKNDYFPVTYVSEYLKKEGIWYGTYIYLKGGSQLVSDYRKNSKFYVLENIKSSFENFEKVETSSLGFSESTGDLEKVLEKNSKIYQWSCIARKVN